MQIIKAKEVYDVVVIGGGPAGTLAALSAARGGARTLLIEEGAFLGGMLTKAGVGPQMTYHAGETQVVRGFPEELVQRMAAAGFSPGHMPDAIGFASSITPFDPEGMKLIWERTVLESGVKILYYTRLLDCLCQDEKITKIIVCGREGLSEVAARVFVDCSGDAELAYRAGCPTLYGREKDHLAQPMTMNLRVSAVDRGRFMDYIEAQREDFYPGMRFSDLNKLPRIAAQGAYSLIIKAKEAGEFDVDRQMILCFETNRPGEFILNMSRVVRRSPLLSEDMSEAEIEGRRQAGVIMRFMRGYIPGFEKAELLASGPFIGVREGRRIQAVYQLNADDLLANTMFEDAVAMGGYPVDIHAPDGSEMAFRGLRAGSWYAIPYRSLLSPAKRNLLVAGRCMGATHEALAAVRVSPILEAVGQAAGTAAALLASVPGSDGADARCLNTNILREKLADDGAFLIPYK